MKLKLNLVNGAAFVCLAAFTARADDAMPPQTSNYNYNDTNQIHEMHGLMRAYQFNGALKSSELTGMKVVSSDGQNLGRVNDLLLDVQAGRVVQVIVSSGGVLGIGGSLMTVPPGALDLDASNRVVRINVDKSMFLAGPKFVTTNYSEEYEQSNAVVENYHYYGERPFFANARYGTNIFEETSSGVVALNMDGTPAANGNRLMDLVYNQRNWDTYSQDTNSMTDNGFVGGTNAATGNRLMDIVNNQKAGDTIQDTNAMADNSMSTTNAAVGGGRMMDIVNGQKTTMDDTLQDTNSLADNRSTGGTEGAWTGGRHFQPAQLGYLQRASKLKGLTVRNPQGETVGTIKDFAVDLGAGRIVAVIISTGGYLDMGSELSAVPPSVLRYNGDHDGVEFDTTKDSLAKAPHFSSSQWPDMNKQAYVGNVYHSYRVNPYFSTNSYNANGVAADNTGRNVRDRNGRNLTPMDQGNNAEDIRITSEIRKEVVANQALSVNAKNVKIITLNGKVTLRGTVNTDDEKSTIGDIASRIAQPSNVDNELEVRNTARN